MSDDYDKTFEIENCEVLRETQKSILVEADIFDEPTWIPVSQIDDDSEVYGIGHTGTLIVTSWLARTNGWI